MTLKKTKLIPKFNIKVVFLILIWAAVSNCSSTVKNRIISSTDSTYSWPFQVNIDKMVKFLEEIKLKQSLPNFTRAIRAQDLDPKWRTKCKAITNGKLFDLYSGLVKLVFSNIEIPIYNCRWQFQTGTLLRDGIFLSTTEVLDLEDSTILSGHFFTIAHEISHYIHEISTQDPYSKKEGYSLNGYPSYRLDNYEECEKLKRQDRKWDCELALWEHGHSEVDIYAVLILKKYGFESWEITKSAWLRELERNNNLSSEEKIRAKDRINKRFDIIKSYL